MIDKEKAIEAQSRAHIKNGYNIDEHLLTADQLRELIDKSEKYDFGFVTTPPLLHQLLEAESKIEKINDLCIDERSANQFTGLCNSILDIINNVKT